VGLGFEAVGGVVGGAAAVDGVGVLGHVGLLPIS
jgi:hypothetical protein